MESCSNPKGKRSVSYGDMHSLSSFRTNEPMSEAQSSSILGKDLNNTANENNIERVCRKHSEIKIFFTSITTGLDFFLRIWKLNYIKQ